MANSMFEGWALFAIILSTLPYAIIGAVLLPMKRDNWAEELPMASRADQMEQVLEFLV